jgi:hypothetical protein
MRVCSVEGCGKKHDARGLCSTHYKRLKFTGTTDPRVRISGCSVDGCDMKNYGHGLCSKHYARLRRHGTTDDSGKRKDRRGTKLLSPDGVEHIIAISLRDFCMEHDLQAQNMFKVIKGQRGYHKGWTCPGAGFVPAVPYDRNNGYREKAPYRACSVEGCETDSKTADLCEKHRQRLNKFGRTHNINRGYGEKRADSHRCSHCGEDKPMSSFHKAGLYVDREQRYRADCKDCVLEAAKRNYKDNREAMLEKGRKWKRENLDWCLSYSAQYQKERPHLVRKWKKVSQARNKERFKTDTEYRKKEIAKRKRENAKFVGDISDRYAANLIGVKNPPQKLIELKRVQLKITRALKNEHT